MKPWFYATSGQQNGPVSQEELMRLIGTGTVKASDLVWCEGMPNWTPAGEVAELTPPPPPPRPVSTPASAPEPLNPYQASSPVSWEQPQELSGNGEEIVPGSDPLVIGDCIRRAFELTKRHFWPFFAACAIFFAISMAYSVVSGVLVEAVTEAADSQDVGKGLDALLGIIGQVIDLFLGLGLIRIGLNIVSGRPFAVEMLIGQGDKLFTSIGAAILYYLIVLVGLILLIIPGFYLALRLGQYQNGIVDKNLGAIDSLKYSARITQGNMLNLFGLGVVCFLIVLAGILALLLGVCFAGPLVYLANVVAYRWLIHGRKVVNEGYSA